MLINVYKEILINNFIFNKYQKFILNNVNQIIIYFFLKINMLTISKTNRPPTFTQWINCMVGFASQFKIIT